MYIENSPGASVKNDLGSTTNPAISIGVVRRVVPELDVVQFGRKVASWKALAELYKSPSIDELRSTELSRSRRETETESEAFCADATSLLRSAGIKFREVSLGLEWLPGLLREPAKRAALLEITGQSSLPHVFVGGESIGGLYSGSPGLLEAMESGQLQRLVEEAKEAVR